MAIYFRERERKYRDQGQQQATSNAEREQGVSGASERHNTPGGTFYKAVRFGQANVPLWTIGGSNGGASDALPSGPKLFQFHAVFRKKLAK